MYMQSFTLIPHHASTTFSSSLDNWARKSVKLKILSFSDEGNSQEQRSKMVSLLFLIWLSCHPPKECKLLYLKTRAITFVFCLKFLKEIKD